MLDCIFQCHVKDEVAECWDHYLRTVSVVVAMLYTSHQPRTESIPTALAGLSALLPGWQEKLNQDLKLRPVTRVFTFLLFVQISSSLALLCPL